MNNDWHKYYQDRLNHDSLPEVPDYIWENVRPYIPVRKNDRPPLLIPIFTCGLLMGSLCYLLFAAPEKDGNQESLSNVTRTDVQFRENHASNKNIDHAIITSLDRASATYTTKYNDFKKSSKTSQNFALTNSIVAPITTNNTDKDIINEEPDLKERSAESMNQDRLINTAWLQASSNQRIASNNVKKTLLNLAYGAECYSFSKKNRNIFFVELLAGPLYAPFTLHSDNPEEKNIARFRKNIEQSFPGLNAGIRAGMLRKKFSFRTGLDYSQIYELLSYKNPVDTNVIQVLLNGNPVRTDTLIGYRAIKIHNYHRLINIPLIAGYDFRVGKGKVTPMVGAEINILARHRGALLDRNVEPEYFTTGTNSQTELYKTQLGIDPVAAIQYSTPLQPGLWIFGEAAAKLLLSPMNKEAYPLEQKYMQFRMNAGVRYIF
ncbi:MAG: hypothetical protein K1X68_07150 [Saprospiraceae bacterium]|nr:hypothetical protein [Saprospiraceae bacterium]HMW39054.1 hypothetical protein [Saprospiraceae bacterium]HMX88424.1 hypothetical protein [Saprospiraceae bacterium]HMZ39066.1 hypothetical protein [Saprospiraceae bacterium]HNA63406.1 hypothetical protein [Saprospiraceae bacterium]